MFQSERFYREAWPTISQAVSPSDAARDVTWIATITGVPAGARVLDAPCGFGRHSIEFARRGHVVTGVDFNETEIDRAREAAHRAGEDRMVLDRFWGALRPGGVFVLDTRNRDQLVRSLPPEERQRFDDWTLRIEHSFDATTSRWRARWSRLPLGSPTQGVLVGESDIRLYSAHELAAMLRPERWSRLDFYGALDGTPFSLDAPRLVIAART